MHSRQEVRSKADSSGGTKSRRPFSSSSGAALDFHTFFFIQKSAPLPLHLQLAGPTSIVMPTSSGIGGSLKARCGLLDSTSIHSKQISSTSLALFPAQTQPKAPPILGTFSLAPARPSTSSPCALGHPGLHMLSGNSRKAEARTRKT